MVTDFYCCKKGDPFHGLQLGSCLTFRNELSGEIHLLTKQEILLSSGTPLQYSCLEIPMDGGAWWAAVHGVVKSQTRLSDFPFTLHFHALEKEMATHSSVLAWRIPRLGDPGGLPSMGSHRVGHDCDLVAAAAVVAAACMRQNQDTNTGCWGQGWAD